MLAYFGRFVANVGKLWQIFRKFWHIFFANFGNFLPFLGGKCWHILALFGKSWHIFCKFWQFLANFWGKCWHILDIFGIFCKSWQISEYCLSNLGIFFVKFGHIFFYKIWQFWANFGPIFLQMLAHKCWHMLAHLLAYFSMFWYIYGKFWHFWSKFWHICWQILADFLQICADFLQMSACFGIFWQICGKCLQIFLQILTYFLQMLANLAYSMQV